MCDFVDGHGSYHKTRREAADAANFAHMIILACDRKIEDGHRMKKEPASKSVIIATALSIAIVFLFIGIQIGLMLGW